MVATNETMLETEAAGKSGRRRGTSAASASVVDPVVSRGEKKHSQSFSYDPLNRLTANTLGGVANQSWTLDTDYVLLRQEPKSRLSEGAAYRETSFTSNGTTQTRTANAQNQITSISGTTGTPAYDANGNMTTDQNGNTLVYNAWNQLVAVKNSAGAVIAQYSYDARGYRISETYPVGGNGVAADTTNYIYYDSSWQAIETRTGGTANSNVTSQTVWSAAYVNAAVLQDAYSGGVIQPNSRIYFQQDANWDTTAIVGYNATSGTWGVTQRYVYSPYGTITVLNADWSTPASGTQPLVNNLYQGMTLDSVTGLYYERNRNYSPLLGTWTSQDPLRYINGANTYQFVMSNPVGNVDPWGLDPGFDASYGATGYTVPQGPTPPPSWVGGLGQAMLNGAGQQMGQTHEAMNASGEDMSPKAQAYTTLGAGVAGAVIGAIKYIVSHPLPGTPPPVSPPSHCKDAPSPPATPNADYYSPNPPGPGILPNGQNLGLW